MNDLIKQAELLKKAIKMQENNINNPALVTSMLNELDFFIENVKDE